ncbi:MAG TPA: hypothetical protein VMS02_07470 [Solirubrobacteraceae bacterium]|nr:hypothetical protein [Solirubrobacteraceae bacterium]
MRRALSLTGALALAALALALLGRAPGGVSAAAGAGPGGPPTAGDSFEPDLGLPATGVVVFGSSVGEAPGETWAYGDLGRTPVEVAGKPYDDQYTLLEHSNASPAWQVVPLPEGPEGKPLASGNGSPATYGALAGRATEAGGVVLLSGQDIVVRDPDGQPRLVPAPAEPSSPPTPAEPSSQPTPATPSSPPATSEPSPPLVPGESLLPPASSNAVTVPYDAVEEEDQRTGLLIAPYHDGGPLGASGQPAAQPGVLHYDGRDDGRGWTREQIEATSEELDHFTALAISCSGTQSAPGASSPENCWLLAGYGTHEVEQLALFRRVRAGAAGGWSWQVQPVADWLLGNAAPPSGVSRFHVAPLAGGAQMLTATAQGVWVDFEAHVNGEAAAIDASELVLAPSEAGGKAQVAGTWCYPTGPLCGHSLGASLPKSYRSFAWPGASAGDPGTRVITGLGGRAMLELYEGNFAYMPGAGGEPGLDPGGAALFRSSPQKPVEGWVADGVYSEDDAPDGEGQSQAIALTSEPEGDPSHEGDRLHSESVPFRHPLLAVAQAPGTTPGDPDAEALAVGLDGQVGRYVPGEGWRPETLYGLVVAPPTLRAVAWPEAGRAYAVGDNGAMWLWRAETGLWEPDPAKPFNFIGNLDAIAFDPSEPLLGYAVGKQGVLLAYGKSWEQISAAESQRLEEELHVPEQSLNFTSVAFAGSEALATYRVVVEEHEEQIESGGLLINEGSGWHVDGSAASLLGGLPAARDTVLSKVAGLPDGGAVAAGPDLVIERESPSAPWQLSPVPLPEARSVSALAAFREAGGGVRAMISIELDRSLEPGLTDGNLANGPFAGDVPIPTGEGQPPPFIPPDPLPNSGYLLEQTASGWLDMEHEALPAHGGDMPMRPDPVLAVVVEPSGARGLAVGGQTYDVGGGGPEEKAETAAAMRFPAGAGVGGASPVPIVAPAGQASFAVGGMADCAEACFDLANDAIGPDVWLTHALQSAQQIVGARAFLYTGGRVPGPSIALKEGGEAFERELARFVELLGAAGPMPVYPAASSELQPPGSGAGAFQRMLLPHGATACTTAAGTPCPDAGGAYSLTTTGSQGGPVQTIVLDFLGNTLEAAASSAPHAQEEWLERELQSARAHGLPAIVMGFDALGFQLPDQNSSINVQAADAEAVSRILVRGGASAYLFDYPGVDVQATVSYQGTAIPAFGSGTLGTYEPATGNTDALHSSAYLLLSVDTAARNAATNVAPVSARAIPNVGLLSLNATGGTLLHRSQVALFEGLARRPPAGVFVGGGDTATQGVLIYPFAYDPIPSDCQGPNCAYEVPLEYTFTSSNPDVGGFVEHEASSADPNQVQLNVRHQPVPDEPRNAKGELLPGGRFTENSRGQPVNEKGETLSAADSGLFCPYNEGTTTITIATGGLSYSMPVTVQGGSVEYPCGTVPLKNPPPRVEPGASSFPVPSLAPASPVAPSVQPQLLPVPPAPPAPPPHPKPPHPRPHRPTPVYPFVPLQAGLALLRPLIVPPPLSPVQPTPPSGTSSVQVYQNAVAPQSEREEEEALDIVHNMAAYGPQPGRPVPPYLPAVILVLAVAGATIVGGRQARRLRLARNGGER